MARLSATAWQFLHLITGSVHPGNPWSLGTGGLGPRQSRLVAALRSGEYTQTQGVLYWYKPGSGECLYCVQGVAQKESGEPLREPGGFAAVMSKKARDYFSMHQSGANYLLRLNDGVAPLTFPQMADLIEYAPHAFFYGPA